MPLLKSRRQLLHRHVAEILRGASTAATAPEAIAHHFTQAGLIDDAIEWWGKAGDQALRRSALPGGYRTSRESDRDGRNDLRPPGRVRQPAAPKKPGASHYKQAMPEQ
jgi:hypothetical protein